MILNSYSLQKAVLMNKKRRNYENSVTLIPKNTIYTSLTGDFIKKQEKNVEEIKKVTTGPKKKPKKKGIPQVLDLTDLDDIELPDLKVDDSDIYDEKKKEEEDDEEEKEEKEVVGDEEEKEEKEDVGDEEEKEEKEDDEEPVKVEKPKNDKKEEEDEEPKKGGGVDDKNIKKIVVTSFF